MPYAKSASYTVYPMHAQAQLCAHVSSSAIQGFILMAVLSCLQLLFSGYIITYADMPGWLEWAVFGSFMRFCTGQLMANEFSNFLGYQGDIILYFWDYQHFKFWRTRNVLFFYFFGLELLVLLTLLIPKSEVKKMDSVEQLQAHAGSSEIESGCHPTDNPLVQTDHSRPYDDSFCSNNDAHKMNTEEAYGASDGNLEHEDIFKASKSLPSSCAVNFVFKEVTYTLKGGSKKELLKGISGIIKPCELCAVLGLSGSGVHLNVAQSC